MSKHSLRRLNRKMTRRAVYRTKQELAMYHTTMFPIKWTWILRVLGNIVSNSSGQKKAFSWFVINILNCNSSNLSQKDSTVWCSGISSCVLMCPDGDHVMLHKVPVRGALVVFMWINLGVDGWYYHSKTLLDCAEIQGLLHRESWELFEWGHGQSGFHPHALYDQWVPEQQDPPYSVSWWSTSYWHPWKNSKTPAAIDWTPYHLHTSQGRHVHGCAQWHQTDRGLWSQDLPLGWLRTGWSSGHRESQLSSGCWSARRTGSGRGWWGPGSTCSLSPQSLPELLIWKKPQEVFGEKECAEKAGVDTNVLHTKNVYE